LKNGHFVKEKEKKRRRKEKRKSKSGDIKKNFGFFQVF